MPLLDDVADRSASEGDLDRRLRERFGLGAFHAWQRQAVEEVLRGRRRVLVVAPTGGGKSLVYQFPATELTGTTVVVSPLIALMDDQVRALDARGIAATYLASTLDPDERRRREAAVRDGRYRLVYVAPERLAHAGTVEALARLRPPLVAVDEAHCISHWGHDFRPDYLRLGEVLAAIRPPRVVACTATATPAVRAEILDRLGLPPDGTAVILRGFARPNLHLGAVDAEGAAAVRSIVDRTLREALGRPSAPSGGAIVYAATRRAAEQAAAHLRAKGWNAAAYHAGLDAAERARVSAEFASRRLPVVAATNAFGMGIDRPDIRAVVHAQAPGSIEAYYQEVGRAGRDGQPARGLLVSTTADFGLRRRLIESDREGRPADPALVERAWRLFLDLMRYVEAGSCRHDFILRYFGDEQETLGGCGHCDVCERLERTGADAGDRRVSEEDAIVVRKALAGLARNRGRAGLVAVADMLRGDASARMDKLGLSRLSTFGLLSDRPRPWIVSLLRRLITAGLAELTPTEFPVPVLTPLGAATMRGDEPVRVLPPEQDAAEAPEPAPRLPAPAAAALDAGREEAALFERLRAARAEMARARGVPAYVVCHDRTLLDMAARRPASLGEMAAVHGMGPARIEAYGRRFLGVVRGES